MKLLGNNIVVYCSSNPNLQPGLSVSDLESTNRKINPSMIFN